LPAASSPQELALRVKPLPARLLICTSESCRAEALPAALTALLSSPCLSCSSICSTALELTVAVQPDVMRSLRGRGSTTEACTETSWPPAGRRLLLLLGLGRAALLPQALGVPLGLAPALGLAVGLFLQMLREGVALEERLGVRLAVALLL
jgi:hypothetical protein